MRALQARSTVFSTLANMAIFQIAADPKRAHRHLIQAYSLEVSARDIPVLGALTDCLDTATTLSIPCLPRDKDEARLATTRAVHLLGHVPMPHLVARRVASMHELESFVQAAVAQAGVTHCLVLAGDLSKPKGPFPDSTSLIETGVFEHAGMQVIAVAGHPDSHPVMSRAQCWEVLERKCSIIEARGMRPWIITQFTFDADLVLNWLVALRERGLDHPVRVGVPGPAGVADLLRYAALCGVSACTSAGSKYGPSLGKLLGTAWPERFVQRLNEGLTEAHGEVRLHFFPFGGAESTLRWIEKHRSSAKPTLPFKPLR